MAHQKNQIVFQFSYEILKNADNVFYQVHIVKMKEILILKVSAMLILVVVKMMNVYEILVIDLLINIYYLIKT